MSVAEDGKGVVPADVGVFMAEMDGVATSIILSAISASLSNAVPSGVEAKTMRTLWGRR